MSEHDHDEIARRLRETGTVPAPERLQGEVMDQVRAEPRLRPSRRSFLAPVIPYAAAAAVLGALVLALSHLGGSGGGSASSAEGGATAAGGATRSASPPQPSASAAGVDALGDQEIFRIPAGALQNAALAPYVKAHTSASSTVVLAVPSARFHEYRQRLRAIQQRTRGDDTIRVILRPAR